MRIEHGRRRLLRPVAVVGGAFVLLLILSISGCGGSSPSSLGSGSPTLRVGTQATQTIDGFGASGAWWPIDLVNFPRASQQHVAEMLFSPRGIALSGYRYNIGGGGVGVTDPTRSPATFLLQPGVYDWSADLGGTLFLKLAQQFGVPKLTGFVNSAPPEWTTNGKSCGGALLPGSENAYATYLADVVAHFQQADGVTLSYISPMNEPDNSFSSCGQEGMAVPVDQRTAVVQAVGKALTNIAPHSKVIADESSLAYVQSLEETPLWLSGPLTSQWLAAIAHHAYDFPTDSQLAKVAGLSSRFHRPLWMTEICCKGAHGFGAQFDPTIASGLWLADTIWSELTAGESSAFYWWTALSSKLGCDPVADFSCVNTVNTSGWNDGLLYYDPSFKSDGNYSVYPTKRFYVMGNFSRYVRPGAVGHPVSGSPPGIRGLAFTKDGRWTVIVINDRGPAGPASTLRIALPNNGTGLRASSAVQTSASTSLAPVALPHSAGTGQFVTTVPTQSVTTFSFKPG